MQIELDAAAAMSQLRGKPLLHSAGACTVWLTGLSGAGKSTLAAALERHLKMTGRACCVLDGDAMRRGLCSDLGFSQQDRSENIRRIAETAKLMNDAGMIAIAALISPYEADRAHARRIIGGGKFFEVYVSTPLAVCEQRDPKGHYRRARSGELAQFTGVSAPYEAPRHHALRIDTSTMPLEECANLLARELIGCIDY